MNNDFFLPDRILPKGFRYPATYITFVNNDLPDFYPWYIISNNIESMFNGLKTRYPNRIMVPFARRRDNDDYACFEAAEVSEDPEVLMIHDFASSGWEFRGKFDNFLAWIDCAKEDSEIWHNYSCENKNI